MLGMFIKRPIDEVDYDLDWEPWLCDDGDTVASATAQCTRTDGTPSSVSAINVQTTADSVKVWLVGGEPGESVRVTVVATTTKGRVKQVEFQIRVKD